MNKKKLPKKYVVFMLVSGLIDPCVMLMTRTFCIANYMTWQLCVCVAELAGVRMAIEIIQKSLPGPFIKASESNNGTTKYEGGSISTKPTKERRTFLK